MPTTRNHARLAMLSLLGCLSAVRAFAAAPPAAVGVEGFLEPYRHIDVAAPEPGIVETIAVAEGDRVAAGQIVAELKQDTLRASLRVAERSRDAHGRLDNAEADLRLQTNLAEKLTELQSRRHATQEEVDRAVLEQEMAAARLLTVREDLEIRALECRRIETEIENRRLRSPIDGIVIRLARDQGEYVSPNDPAVLTVVQLNLLKGVFSAPPETALQLKPGQEVQLAISDRAGRVPATVEFISPLVDPRSGTITVNVKVDNSGAAYKAGQRCRLLSAPSATPIAPSAPPTVQTAEQPQPIPASR